MSCLYLNKTRLNFTSNFLDQNSLKSKYYCKNEFIYIRDFETVKKKTRSRVVLDVKALGFALIIHFCSFFKQYKPLTNQRALH